MSCLEYNEVVKKTFGSEKEGWFFYNKYARGKGFSVRKSYCEWNNGKTERILRRLVCSCEGFREEKELMREVKKRKPRNITRVGCYARLVIALDQNTRRWYVKEFIYEHNHPMADQDLACFLRSHRRISDEQKAEIVALQISGIRKHQIMDIMEVQYGGYDNVGFITRDLYNFCHRIKVETVGGGDAETVIRYLTGQRCKDPDFFFDYKTDEKGHLTGLLWCDCQSRLDYAAFGDVIVFDSTYKTNRYNMALVPIVGVNHHGSTVLFACGIISQEKVESYVWILRAFSDAMSQKYPVSVLTDGDLAMQRAIGQVWPHASHRLCIWHIEQNIVRNIGDDDLKNEFRNFLYDCCSIKDLQLKWLKFLVKHKVPRESWIFQMYERREKWCAAYHVGKCYLGLRSNQRSESLNSRLQRNLDLKMTLIELVAHFDHCIWRIRGNEAFLDFEAKNSSPCLQPDASIIEKEAAEAFTPSVFAIVQYSIKAAKKCFVRDIIDLYDVIKYIVCREDKGDKEYHVDCEVCVDEGIVKGISCSCLRLQSLGTPCSHMFFVLGYRKVRKLPDCCVLKRWTKWAKSAFPSVRKSTMYDYTDILQRYHELRNISLTTSFISSRSPEAYERLKHLLYELYEEAAMIMPNEEEEEDRDKWYGPVLQEALDDDFVDIINVLDPIPVPGRGAPKKKLKSILDKNKSSVKCTQCKGEGHNRRTCSMRKEEAKLPEDVLDI